MNWFMFWLLLGILAGMALLAYLIVLATSIYQVPVWAICVGIAVIMAVLLGRITRDHKP